MFEEFNQYFEEAYSKKQERRVEKFLKENKFEEDPSKTTDEEKRKGYRRGTIETDILDENGKKKRIPFEMTPHNTIPAQVLPKKSGDKDEYTIQISKQVLSRKPAISNFIFKHEEGHVAIHLDKSGKYVMEMDKIDKILTRLLHKMLTNKKDALNEHDMNPEEFLADKYGKEHSKYNKTSKYSLRDEGVDISTKEALKGLQSILSSDVYSRKNLNKDFNAYVLPLAVDNMHQKYQELSREYSAYRSILKTKIECLNTTIRILASYKGMLNKAKAQFDSSVFELKRYKTDIARAHKQAYDLMKMYSNDLNNELIIARENGHTLSKAERRKKVDKMYYNIYMAATGSNPEVSKYIKYTIGSSDAKNYPEKLKKELDHYRNQVIFGKSNVQDITNSIQEIQKQVDDYTKNITDMKTDLQQMSAELDKYCEMIKDKKSMYKSDEFQKCLDRIKFRHSHMISKSTLAIDDMSSAVRILMCLPKEERDRFAKEVHDATIKFAKAEKNEHVTTEFTYEPLSEFNHFFRESNEPRYINFCKADVSLQPADEYDLHKVKQFKIATIVEGYPDIKSSKEEYDKIINYVEREAPTLLQNTKMIIFDGNDTIGMITSYQKNNDWFIDDIYLIPECRCKGVGRMILEKEIMDHNNNDITLWVYKHNTHAISLYESLGFVKESETQDRQFMRLKQHKQTGDITISDKPVKILSNTFQESVEYTTIDEISLNYFGKWVKLPAVTINSNFTENYSDSIFEDMGKMLPDLVSKSEDIFNKECFEELKLQMILWDMEGDGDNVQTIKNLKIDDIIDMVNPQDIYFDYTNTGEPYMILECKCKIDIEHGFGFLFNKAADLTEMGVGLSGLYISDNMLKKQYFQESTTGDNNKMIPVTNFEFNKVYYGDPIKRTTSMICDDNRPLFATPYPGIASIFSGRDNIRKILREKGCKNYNLGYDEWGFDLSKLKKPLSEVHVRVEGYPDLKSFTYTYEGYIHTIDVSNIKQTLYQYPWMSNDKEVLIANMKEIPIENVEKVRVTYIVSGAKSRKTFQEGVLQTKKRNKLDDSDFGIPETRSFPLHDKAHVEAAVKMFPNAPLKYRKSLAKRILMKAEEFGIDTSNWKSLNNYK